MEVRIVFLIKPTRSKRWNRFKQLLRLIESNLAKEGHKSPIKKVYLAPQTAKPNPDVLWAIQNAEIILIGPGSVYTSIIPNLLLKDVTAAIVKSKARKIYICNISTERGETEKYTVEDHVRAIIRHSHPRIFNTVLVNERIVYFNNDKGELGKIANISTENKKISRYKIINADLIDIANPLFHDREKLAKAIMEI